MKSVGIFPNAMDERESQFALCQGMILHIIEQNTIIFVQGQPGSSYYVNFSGTIDILQHRHKERAEEILSTYEGKIFQPLGADFRRSELGILLCRIPEYKGFGELALVKGTSPRAGSALASVPSELLEVRGQLYEKTLKPYHIDQANIGVVFDAIFEHPLFVGLTGRALTNLAYQMRAIKFSIRNKICNEGDKIERAFLLTNGEVQEFTIQDGVQIKTSTKSKNAVIGGEDLLKGKRCFSHGYVAASPVDGYAIPLDAFSIIMGNRRGVRVFLGLQNACSKLIKSNITNQSKAIKKCQSQKSFTSLAEAGLKTVDETAFEETITQPIVQQKKRMPILRYLLSSTNDNRNEGSKAVEENFAAWKAQFSSTLPSNSVRDSCFQESKAKDLISNDRSEPHAITQKLAMRKLPSKNTKVFVQAENSFPLQPKLSIAELASTLQSLQDKHTEGMLCSENSNLASRTSRENSKCVLKRAHSCSSDVERMGRTRYSRENSRNCEEAFNRTPLHNRKQRGVRADSEDLNGTLSQRRNQREIRADGATVTNAKQFTRKPFKSCSSPKASESGGETQGLFDNKPCNETHQQRIFQHEVQKTMSGNTQPKLAELDKKNGLLEKNRASRANSKLCDTQQQSQRPASKSGVQQQPQAQRSVSNSGLYSPQNKNRPRQCLVQQNFPAQFISDSSSRVVNSNVNPSNISRDREYSSPPLLLSVRASNSPFLVDTTDLSEAVWVNSIKKNTLQVSRENSQASTLNTTGQQSRKTRELRSSRECAQRPHSASPCTSPKQGEKSFQANSNELGFFPPSISLKQREKGKTGQKFKNDPSGASQENISSMQQSHITNEAHSQNVLNPGSTQPNSNNRSQMQTKQPEPDGLRNRLTIDHSGWKRTPFLTFIRASQAFQNLSSPAPKY